MWSKFLFSVKQWNNSGNIYYLLFCGTCKEQNFKQCINTSNLNEYQSQLMWDLVRNFFHFMLHVENTNHVIYYVLHSIYLIIIILYTNYIYII
jgi:hypothetical protein